MKRKKLNTHLTLEARIFIENALNEGKSITQISLELDRHKSNITREIMRHKTPAFPSSFNNSNACIKHKTCPKEAFECYKYCKGVEINLCDKLKSSPHVCNGCTTKQYCRHVKYYYKANEANLEYKKELIENRRNLHYSELELNVLNNDFKTLVFQNGSIYHSLKVINDSGYNFKRSTIYWQIKNNKLELKTCDLPRTKIRSKKDSKDKSYKSSKVKDHTYEDYIKYKESHSNACELQMDTVQGIIDKDEPVMLTLYIIDINFMFIFKLDKQTIDNVINKINYFKNIINSEDENKFKTLFEIWLTDNGKEFNNVEKMVKEFTESNIFYCHPYASYEKGSIEKNHEFIRRVIPKGVSLKEYNQDDYNLLASHINSLYRENLDGKCPFDLVEKYISLCTLKKLGYKKIDPKDVTLNPILLGQKNINNIKCYLSEKDIKKIVKEIKDKKNNKS